MRVLWVTGEPPDRRGGGGNIRQSLLLGAIAAVHDVDLLVAGGPPDRETVEHVKRVLEVPADPVRKPQGRNALRLLDLGIALHGGPRELFDNRNARAALEASWPAEHYDVVLVEHAGLAPLVSRRRAGEHWTCTLQNIASGTAGALRDLAPAARQRWLLGREAKQAKALEQLVVDRFDSVITVSEEDARLLPGESTVIPNGVDVHQFVPTPLPATPSLVFTGTLSYLPNVDGLTWFCREVLPLVRAVVPDTTFDIVGRDPVASVIALADGQSVRLHVNVPDVAPYLAAGQVAVVPLRVGTGSRLKALEAMASGRPVAGTTVGLAGLTITDEALVRDDAAGLAAGICQLLSDDAAAATLAAKGRALVEQSFDWDAIGPRLVAHLASISATSRPI